jgi:hypothetical protein
LIGVGGWSREDWDRDIDRVGLLRLCFEVSLEVDKVLLCQLSETKVRDRDGRERKRRRVEWKEKGRRMKGRKVERGRKERCYHDDLQDND